MRIKAKQKQAFALQSGCAAYIFRRCSLGMELLYLAILSKKDLASYSQETPDGMLLCRSIESDEVTGLTVVNWWKRFGGSKAPDSLRQIEQCLEPFAGKLAA
jgi:hypothetical protein